MFSTKEFLFITTIITILWGGMIYIVTNANSDTDKVETKTCEGVKNV